MSKMDEISYWIVTKRAPCLMNHDNMYKKNKNKPNKITDDVIHSISDDSREPSPIKKRRKLAILDGESESPNKQENVYFETPNIPNQKTAPSSCQSSDLDFNIKKSASHNKTKRKIPLKVNRRNCHKRELFVASSPKISMDLRRSLRTSRKSYCDSNRINSSFEIFNSCMNGDLKQNVTPIKIQNSKSFITKIVSNTPETAVCNSKEVDKTKEVRNHKSNGKFDDDSDVSGFTANYIKSTKITSKHSKKMSQGLLRESQKDESSSRKQNKLIVNVNKAATANTLPNNILNMSTDSSQNCLNLVTLKNDVAHNSADKSTSVLKFLDVKLPRRINSRFKSKISAEISPNIDVGLSPQTNNDLSRYPKRCKKEPMWASPSPSRVRKSKQCSVKSRSRVSTPRKSRNLKLTPNKSSDVLEIAENDSSAVTLNVASTSNVCVTKRRSASKSLSRKRSEDKSAVTAGFSDSDDDKPLKPKKFFA